MPLLKYSSSSRWLRFSKGSTAMDLSAGRVGAGACAGSSCAWLRDYRFRNAGRLALCELVPGEVAQPHHQYEDDDAVQLAPCLPGDGLRTIDFFLALDAFRRQFERPGEEHGQRKTEHQQQ